MMKFQEEMTELRRCTMNMASLTASMVERSIDVLLDLDLEGAERMVDDFTKVDRLDRKIEESAIRILTLYQPMASDMRAVATYMKSITYMERIAKYCKNIAVAAQYLKDKPTYDVCECLRPMGDTAAEMVRIVIDTVDSVFHTTAGHIDLTADNGLDACSLGGLIEVDTAVHDAMIRNGNCILADLLQPVHHAANAAGAVKKAVFGMYMQMNKTHCTASFAISTNFFSR
jgi:hypothetical protein